MYSLLLKYKKRGGHCNVPKSHQEDGQNLGIWLSNQRQNKRKGVLDKDLEDRLTDIGVVLDPLSKQWEDMYSLLLKYKKREGHCDVPQSHQEDGQTLGIWLNNKRQKKRKGLLDKDMEDIMTNLGVVWDLLSK